MWGRHGCAHAYESSLRTVASSCLWLPPSCSLMLCTCDISTSAMQMTDLSRQECWIMAQTVLDAAVRSSRVHRVVLCLAS